MEEKKPFETYTVEVAIVIRAENEDEALEIVSNLLKPIDPHNWEITDVVNHKDL
jgi:deferrochelatase/peroxidase EfeB